jgi:hypothetical protein
MDTIQKEIGKKFGAAARMQQELLKTVEEVNRNWLGRMEVERNLASELMAKLTTARLAPEIATAYQDWMTRRMHLIGEDSSRFIADWQKLTNAIMRSFGGGWTGKA